MIETHIGLQNEIANEHSTRLYYVLGYMTGCPVSGFRTVLVAIEIFFKNSILAPRRVVFDIRVDTVSYTHLTLPTKA